MIGKRLPEEPNDSVNLVVSLLVRHPELSRVVIKPRFAGMEFFFVVRGVVGARERLAFRRALADHLRAYRDLLREPAPSFAVRVGGDRGHTFVEIARASRDISRDEIALIVGLVAQTFGERLIVNPPAEDPGDEDSASRDEAVGSALDAVRRARQPKGLVGLRDDRRVLIYFGRSRP